MSRGTLIAVAMSGGIDSSVTALLLKKQGYNVVGLTMELFRSESGLARHPGRCCSPADLRDARLVAGWLNIPHYVIGMDEAFRREIIDPFIKEYLAGRTPSPCILCNSRMKFTRLLNLATQLGASYLATGHYAIIEEQDSEAPLRLLKGLDQGKDQSYFLFDLRQDQLKKLMFPLGRLTKEKVRELADEFSLPVAAKDESQELCFVEQPGYDCFLDNETLNVPGPGNIVDLEERKLGEHSGIHRYTVGQRRGLGIAAGEPIYVVEIRARDNVVVVGPVSALFKDKLMAEDMTWISGVPPQSGTRVTAKIRSRHQGAEASVRIDTPKKGSICITFDTPQKAITPGQAVVLLSGEEVLGGGWIRSAL
ncbi:tRNA 2-thiouridine(34) synthase MnmA [Acidobacteriota bacterium]